MQWDLGEFDQKEDKSTRWGTKEELLRASAVAKEHGIGVIVDAVLNVIIWFFFLQKEQFFRFILY